MEDGSQNIEDILLTAGQIHERVCAMGREISERHSGTVPLLVGVLKGASCFLADLMREINLPLEIDVLSLTRGASGGLNDIAISHDLSMEIKGRNVILVEDIVDTGLTLEFLLGHLWSREPASVEVCALLDKKVKRVVDVPITYIGFEVPDKFVVGYGLDYEERYRNLRYIGAMASEI